MLQTLIHSKILKRVLSRIIRKEKYFWQGKAEQNDSQRYIAALKKSYSAVWTHFKARQDRDERYQELLIEFGLSQQKSWLQMSRPRLKGQPGEFILVTQDPLQGLEPSRAYMIGSLFEISRDALGLSDAELLRVLNTTDQQFHWLAKESTDLQQKDKQP